MKKEKLVFLGALGIGLALILAVAGCGETSAYPDTITVIEGTGLFTRTVPEVKIIKATDEYVLVGYEVPKNQDPETAIYRIDEEGFDSSIDTYTNYGTNLFSDSDDKTYYAGGLYPSTSNQVVSFTFVKQYNQNGILDRQVKSVTVKPSDFKTKSASYTIPTVAKSNVTVYSGKEGDTLGTYNAALGWNDRLIVVTLPTDGIVKYVKYRYKLSSSGSWQPSGSSYGYDPDLGLVYIESDGFDYATGGLNGKAVVSIDLDSPSATSPIVELKFATDNDGYVQTSSSTAYALTLSGYSLPTSTGGSTSGTQGFSISK